MKVYKPETRGRHRMFVQPGNTHKVSDFMDANGKAKLITVEFFLGEADVPDNLGRYLIDQGMAQRSPILLPA